MRGVIFIFLHSVAGINLRRVGETDFDLSSHFVLPSSFVAAGGQVTRDAGVDWWLWIVIGGLVALAALVTFVFRKPSTDEGVPREPKVLLTTEIISCQQIITRSSPQIDPVQLGLTIKGKTAAGEFIELYHYMNAHETDNTSTKFTWDDNEFSWILKQPSSTAVPVDELIIHLEQYSASGGFIAVIASGIVSLKPPMVGAMITPRPAVQLVELVSTSSSGSVWGNMELSLRYDRVIEETMDQLSIARKQLVRKLRVTKPLFLASHSLAFSLIVLDAFLGVRYLFSGCFASSVQALVSACLISLLSIPMAAEWGQMHYNLPSWAVKVGKLNSQFKATVLLACAIPQVILASISGSGLCSKFFETAAGLTFLDFALFSAHFVQAEANGHIAALFHFNCFKRPLPPALPSGKLSARNSEDNTTSNSQRGALSPNSYAARRAQRQPSVDVSK